MMNFLKTVSVGVMIFAFGFCPALKQVPQAPVVATPVVAEAEDEGSILDDYVSGVVEDSDEYTKELDKLVNEFAGDTMDIIEDMLTNPETSPEDMADEIEKRAESFADDMENVSEIFGEIQEIAGNNFGDKFDKDTANSVINVVKGFFRKR